MDKEQEKLIIDALTDFVLRVSKGCSINGEEVPESVRELVETHVERWLK